MADKLIAACVGDPKENGRNFYPWHTRRWLAPRLANLIHATEAEKPDMKNTIIADFVARFDKYAPANLNRGYNDTDKSYKIHVDVSSHLSQLRKDYMLMLVNQRNSLALSTTV
jgi:hypothetical protein